MNMQLQPHHDVFGWIVVAIGTLATLWTIGACIYWTVWPGETDPDHPKRLIFKDDR
jgi:hypothetical protein